jgi:hypothetical protein
VHGCFYLKQYKVSCFLLFAFRELTLILFLAPFVSLKGVLIQICPFTVLQKLEIW